MARLLKFKTRKNGAVSYRQEGSTVSVSFPASAFPNGSPDFLDVVADGLSAGEPRASKPASKDPAVQAALKVIEDAKAARKERLAEKLAKMTPEQIAKRNERLAKLKAKSKKTA